MDNTYFDEIGVTAETIAENMRASWHDVLVQALSGVLVLILVFIASTTFTARDAVRRKRTYEVVELASKEYAVVYSSENSHVLVPILVTSNESVLSLDNTRYTVVPREHLEHRLVTYQAVIIGEQQKLSTEPSTAK